MNVHWYFWVALTMVSAFKLYFWRKQPVLKPFFPRDRLECIEDLVLLVGSLFWPFFVCYWIFDGFSLLKEWVKKNARL